MNATMKSMLTNLVLDLQHHVVLLSHDGKLCLAPFKDTARVLDIGTGTGIWAIQFARLYPRTNVSPNPYAPDRTVENALYVRVSNAKSSDLTGSKVIGTDISLIQPTHNTPPNCEFIREDAEEMWVFDHLFDYIHWTLMFTCCTSKAHLLQRAYPPVAS